jgi:hypothetical protein
MPMLWARILVRGLTDFKAVVWVKRAICMALIVLIAMKTNAKTRELIEACKCPVGGMSVIIKMKPTKAL